LVPDERNAVCDISIRGWITPHEPGTEAPDPRTLPKEHHHTKAVRSSNTRGRYWYTPDQTPKGSAAADCPEGPSARHRDILRSRSRRTGSGSGSSEDFPSDALAEAAAPAFTPEGDQVPHSGRFQRKHSPISVPKDRVRIRVVRRLPVRRFGRSRSASLHARRRSGAPGWFTVAGYSPAAHPKACDGIRVVRGLPVRHFGRSRSAGLHARRRSGILFRIADAASRRIRRLEGRTQVRVHPVRSEDLARPRKPRRISERFPESWYVADTTGKDPRQACAPEGVQTQGSISGLRMQTARLAPPAETGFT
jgi:hypothetical protein